MNLTFEQANLDHAPVFEAHFEQAGDHESAALMAQIAHDEIQHVGFGARWLRAMTRREAISPYEAFLKYLPPLNGPQRARGSQFNTIARESAGLDPDFIARMKRLER